MGAHAERAADIGDLETRIAAARGRDIPSVIVIETDPNAGTDAGGHWWDVAIPEVSVRAEVNDARIAYEQQLALRRTD